MLLQTSCGRPGISNATVALQQTHPSREDPLCKDLGYPSANEHQLQQAGVLPESCMMSIATLERTLRAHLSKHVCLLSSIAFSYGIVMTTLADALLCATSVPALDLADLLQLSVVSI